MTISQIKGLDDAACIRAIRERNPNTLIEVHLRRRGDTELLAVVDAQPDVLAHNVECVRRLTPKVRDPRATYDQSLALLQAVKRIDPDMFTKSSIMVGVGEETQEVIDCMGDRDSRDRFNHWSVPSTVSQALAIAGLHPPRYL